MARLASFAWASLLSVGVNSALFGQRPDPAIRFEVASVKAYGPRDFQTGYPTLGCSGGPGTSSPEAFRCSNVTVEELITKAFDLKPYQAPPGETGRIVMMRAGGGFSLPDGIELLAKVPPGATPEQLRTMLQNLPVDRFKLAFHFGKKDADVYDLVVAKGGPKVKESGVGSSSAPGSAGSSANSVSAVGTSRDCPSFMPPRGRTTIVFNSTQRCAMGSAVTMATLAEFLSEQLKEPVFDATGLKGTYDYKVSYSELSAPARADGAVGQEDVGPSLVGAIQEQLGIRLQKRKGSVEVFVIDHVERTPTEN